MAISANDPDEYPEDAPASLAEEAREAGYSFPYLFDETQEVAKAYTAACTPDFFLFDADRSLVYRGQLDDSRPGNDVPVTGADLRAAIDAVLGGREVASDQRPSVGCSIKWREGKPPERSRTHRCVSGQQVEDDDRGTPLVDELTGADRLITSASR